MKSSSVILLIVATAWAASAGRNSAATLATGADFEDLVLAPKTHWSGVDLVPWPDDNQGEEHPFTSRGTSFYNYYWDTVYEDSEGNVWPAPYWEGWAYSNEINTTTPDWGNQFSAAAKRGVGGSRNYGMAYLPYSPPTSEPEPFRDISTSVLSQNAQGQSGFYATNTTYNYFSMLNGDMFAVKFGWRPVEPGGPRVNVHEPDWFKLKITGLDATDHPLSAAPVDFYLADYRFQNDADDYIVRDWRWVDLSSLVTAGAVGLRLELESSDSGSWGPNTPLYVAIDNPTITATWSPGGQNLWSEQANWGGSALPVAAAVHFAAAGSSSSQNDLTGARLSGLIFDGGAGPHSITGNAVKLNGDVTNLSTAGQSIGVNLELTGDDTWFDAAAGDLVVSGGITGVGSLTKLGTHRLLLSGTNQYSGGTVVDGGVLEIANSRALPVGRTLTIAGGGTVVLASGLTVGSAASSAATVPEPGTAALLSASCLVAIGWWTRRRR